MGIGYDVRRPIFGSPIVAYACDACRSPLESPLAEAGTATPCPVCGASVVTPGVKELEEERARKATEQKDRAGKLVAARTAQRPPPSPPGPPANPPVVQYATPSAHTVPPAVSAAPAEIVFLDAPSVKVTNARVILGNKTYALANINVVHSRKVEPNRGLELLLVGLAGCAFLMAAVRADGSRSLPPSSLIGFGLAAALVVAAVLVWRWNKPLYAVRIGSSSGEGDALVHYDPNWIRRIVDAVNQAIVSRR